VGHKVSTGKHEIMKYMKGNPNALQLHFMYFMISCLPVKTALFPFIALISHVPRVGSNFAGLKNLQAWRRVDNFPNLEYFVGFTSGEKHPTAEKIPHANQLK
jgi:hypothetical protein